MEAAHVLVFDQVKEARCDPVLWGEGCWMLFLCAGRGQRDAPFPDAVAGGGRVGGAEDVHAMRTVEGGGGRLDVRQCVDFDTGVCFGIVWMVERMSVLAVDWIVM